MICIFSLSLKKGRSRPVWSVPVYSDHSSSRDSSSTSGWLSPSVCNVCSTGRSNSQRSPTRRPSPAWPSSSLVTQTAEACVKSHSTAYRSRRSRRSFTSLRSGFALIYRQVAQEVCDLSVRLPKAAGWSVDTPAPAVMDSVSVCWICHDCEIACQLLICVEKLDRARL
jgi:hypothetical protein